MRRLCVSNALFWPADAGGGVLAEAYDPGIALYLCHSYLRGSLLGQTVYGCGKDTQGKEP